MSVYHVKYKTHSASEEFGIDILAKTKADAYDKAVYEEIPKIEGSLPYSAWVFSITYQNGKYRMFKTHEGMPY